MPQGQARTSPRKQSGNKVKNTTHIARELIPDSLPGKQLVDFDPQAGFNEKGFSARQPDYARLVRRQRPAGVTEHGSGHNLVRLSDKRYRDH